MSGAEAAGNYKGVMLCNRPMDVAGTQQSGPAAANLNPQLDAPRFRPVGLPMEQIGLNPSKENVVTNVHAMHKVADQRRAERPDQPKQENYMVKHRKWLSTMAKMKEALNEELQEAALAAEVKRTKFVAYTAAQRRAMREGTAAAASDEDAAAAPCAAPPDAEAEPAAAPAPAKAKAPAKGARPKWAMTEGEADDVEDEEAAALVDFASGLDYDGFIDDLEVRQALTVIKDRIDHQKALEAIEERAQAAEEEEGDWRGAFLAQWNEGDADAASQSARSTTRRKAAADAEPATREWDATTATGESTRAGPSESARQAAEELLKSNPGLASKHSVRSLAAAVEKVGKEAVVAAAQAYPSLPSVSESYAPLE